MKHVINRLHQAWRSSIHRQLSWTFSGVSLVIMLSSGYLLFSYQQHFLYQQDDTRAISIANSLAISSWSKVLTENVAGLDDDIAAAMQTSNLTFIHIISSQGEILASSEHVTQQQPMTIQSIQRLLTLKPTLHVLVDNANKIELAVPIKAKDYPIGWVALGFSRDGVNANLTILGITSIAMAIFFTILIALIAQQLSRRFTRDIESLVVMANAAKEGQDFVRINTQRDDEIGALARDLYQMVDAIQTETEQRKQNETLLAQERDFISTVLNTVGAIIMVINREGSIVRFNRAAETFTGYTFDEVKDQPYFWQHFLREEQRPLIHALFEGIKRGKVTAYYENEWLSRDGRARLFAWTNSIMMDNTQEMTFLVTVGTDISERKAHEQELEHIAHYDALTDLPNRLLLAIRLQQAIMQANFTGQSIAVAYLDLDGFKAINDDYGHDAGDYLLVTLAKRMRLALGADNTIARIGGDEFIIILTNADAAERLQVLQRLLIAAAEPVIYKQSLLQVSASLGVTQYPQAVDVDADLLMRQADQAMYQAKLSGKNCYHLFNFDTQLTTS